MVTEYILIDLDIQKIIAHCVYKSRCSHTYSKLLRDLYRTIINLRLEITKICAFPLFYLYRNRQFPSLAHG